MYTINFKKGRRYKLYGNNYTMLLPRTKTGHIESELVKIRKRSGTPRHSHNDLEQIYIIIKGSGLLEIDGEEKKVCEGTIAYIPKMAEHKLVALDSLEYIYVSCWFGKVPPPRTKKELRAYERKLLERDKVEKKRG